MPLIFGRQVTLCSLESAQHQIYAPRKFFYDVDGVGQIDIKINDVFFLKTHKGTYVKLIVKDINDKVEGYGYNPQSNETKKLINNSIK